MVSKCLKGLKSYSIKLEINNKKTCSKSIPFLKLGNKLMDNLWVKEQKTKETLKIILLLEWKRDHFNNVA